MRLDPHEGKYPTPAERVVEPDTAEHDLWRREQARKQRIYEAKFAETAHLRMPIGGTKSDG